ncbi:MAG: response regulator [Desulfobacterales bacterium]|nr:response regulator [Desulfobacterales bacterium]
MKAKKESSAMSKILVIDDEHSIRKLLNISLTHKGYEVLTAEDGEKGVEIFQRENPPIILTDIKMPGIDGIEVLRRIKQINPKAEVIVITGHGDMDMAIRSLQLDASDFITKPIMDEALSVALSRARERMDIRRKLKEYTNNLEDKVKEATQELRERYEFEGNLVGHSIDGIVATDKQGNIVTFNQGAERIFGHSKDEVVGKMDIRSLYPPGIAEEIRQSLYSKEREIEGMRNWQETFVLGKGGHKIPVRLSGTILYRNGETIGSVAFFHDLREIKRLERELIKSERLAATGQTVAGLADCIKSFLFGLEGGVYVVDKGLKKDDMHKLSTGWNVVQGNIGRISNLVLDLISYSKEDKPKRERCSPNVIADEVCELMESKAKESGIEIVRDVDSNIGEVYLDPKGIHRCLLNLVSNAIDACISDEEDGKDYVVRVTTRLESDGVLTFQVSDNGCGMDEEVRKKMFTSFFSTKGSKGTGLGLLVTQKIAQEHGGTITVDLKPGKGSIFTIWLPRKHQGD